jgi:hypothetical protein
MLSISLISKRPTLSRSRSTLQAKQASTTHTHGKATSRSKPTKTKLNYKTRWLTATNRFRINTSSPSNRSTRKTQTTLWKKSNLLAFPLRQLTNLTNSATWSTLTWLSSSNLSTRSMLRPVSELTRISHPSIRCNTSRTYRRA